MSSFDLTIAPAGLNLAVPTEEEAAQGAQIQIVVPVGLMLPIDRGDGQAAVIPFGIVKIPIANRELAIDFFTKGLEAAQNLPEAKPQIEIAGGLNEAALKAAQEAERRFRGQ